MTKVGSPFRRSRGPREKMKAGIERSSKTIAIHISTFLKSVHTTPKSWVKGTQATQLGGPLGLALMAPRCGSEGECFAPCLVR